MMIGLFHRPPLNAGFRAFRRTEPSGASQKTSNALRSGETAASGVASAALPAGAISIGLFQFPSLNPGLRAFSRTEPSGPIHATSSALGSGEAMAIPPFGSALPVGAIRIGLFQFP